MPSRSPANFARGILGIWNDIAPGAEAFYERWYMREHFPERLGVPGFVRGRRYAAIRGDRKYFTFYELVTPDVLFSANYIGRLNAPTAWTSSIMKSWGPMYRTVCERVRREGEAIGGFVAVARWDRELDLPVDLASRVLGELDDPSVVAVDHWRASQRQNDATAEANARPTPDATIGAALIVEATSEPSADLAVSMMARAVSPAPAPSCVGLYRLIALQDATR